jgi:hypothetical protein
MEPKQWKAPFFCVFHHVPSHSMSKQTSLKWSPQRAATNHNSARENTRMQLYIYIYIYMSVYTYRYTYMYICIYVYSNHIQSHHSHLGVGAISFACPACLESLQTSKVWPFSKEVGLRLGIGNVQELPPQIGAQKWRMTQNDIHVSSDSGRCWLSAVDRGGEML